MDKKINVIDDNGNSYSVEVLNVFNVEGYDHDYIMFTQDDLNNNELDVNISIVLNENGSYRLVNIDDEKEWETVQKAIIEMGGMSNE